MKKIQNDVLPEYRNLKSDLLLKDLEIKALKNDKTILIN